MQPLHNPPDHIPERGEVTRPATLPDRRAARRSKPRLPDSRSGAGSIQITGKEATAAPIDRLRHINVTLAEANAFVRLFHRHHVPVVGHKFSIGAVKGGALVGVVIIGRPVSRMRDDGCTLEVTRLCTDGTRNACSFLYGAAAKAAFALGYDRIGTYTLPSEGGASLRATDWKLVGERGGGSWSVPSRPRVDKHPTEPKLLWEKVDRDREIVLSMRDRTPGNLFYGKLTKRGVDARTPAPEKIHNDHITAGTVNAAPEVIGGTGKAGDHERQSTHGDITNADHTVPKSERADATGIA